MEQLVELLAFLDDANPDVRRVAANHVLSFTSPAAGCLPVLKQHAPSVARSLKNLCADPPATAHDAIAAFINLSPEEEFKAQADDTAFLDAILSIMTDSKNPLAELATMLLSNLSKHEPIAAKLVNRSREPVPTLSSSPRVADLLVELFVKGAGRAYNENAEYHFVASVLADMSTIPKGREYFLNPSYDGQLPLAKIVCFTEHPSIIRRGGADTVLKNCCFDADKHETILDEGKINALPYILLPLCGPEEFDDEDTEGMPEDVQFLPPEKRREVDPHLRLTLIEALLLLTTSRMGRDTLRKRKVYPIVRTLHLAEKDEKVIEIAENLVNMLIRDEAGGAAPGKEASAEGGFETIA